MNNEIGRKITSLTLMTIMLAGAFTAVAPSFMPSASAANANLFVSAENSQFQNHFSGPQIVEVVVIDSDIKDTDKGKGEPDLTINGAKLRMLQGTDGNWYGYFADRVQAQKADAIPRGVGLGANKTSLDFGTFCKNDSFSGILSFASTTGYCSCIKLHQYHYRYNRWNKRSRYSNDMQLCKCWKHTKWIFRNTERS